MSDKNATDMLRQVLKEGVNTVMKDNLLSSKDPFQHVPLNCGSFYFDMVSSV